MKIKLMEWNIHGMGGFCNYSIPVHVLMDAVLAISPDVLVLLEFIEYANGFVDLKHALENCGYSIHKTKYRAGGNGVLMAVKDVFPSEVVDEDVEYLKVKITSDKDCFSVIGTRILTQGKYSKFVNRKILFDSILNRQGDGNFILLLDANNGSIQFESDKDYAYEPGSERYEYNYQQIWREVEKRKWSLVTPERGGPYNHGKYSVVTGKNPDPNKENYHTKEDHIISSFPLRQFSEVDYYWNFVSEANGYGKRTAKDYLSDLSGLPDHGALVALLDLSFEQHDVCKMAKTWNGGDGKK